MTRSSRAHRSARPLKTDLAYQGLKELIVTLEIAPGAPIDERELIHRLEVGRTPLREAIQRLTHEGLIIHQSRRGSWASPLSIIDLRSMIEARSVIEPAVARYAAARITPEQVTAIIGELDESDRLVMAGDMRGLVFHDQRYHSALAQATGNRHLARMSDQVNHALLRYWYVSFVWVGNVADAFKHHRTLLEAIEEGSADKAECLMRDHIDLFRERISDIVAKPNLGAITSLGMAIR